jgi:hypothetical protein
VEHKIRKRLVQRKSAHGNVAVPAELNRSTPRQVRANASGRMVVIAALAVLAAGLWGETVILRRASTAERRASLFANARMVTGGDVVRVEPRRNGNNRRSRVHYQYAVAGQTYTGTTTIATSDGDRYQAGSPIAVWYLPSEPYESWLDGSSPSLTPTWPAIVIPAASVLAALSLILLVRRQLNLLSYGRPAVAVVIRVDKKRSDHGPYWRVQYEWTLLSGATRRGSYTVRRTPPDVGSEIVILYERDNPSRSSKYPLSLVRLVA